MFREASEAGNLDARYELGASLTEGLDGLAMLKKV